ncbi:MAG: PQQ-binding-like beta-propeller repeat protein [Planctomycetaceae bacterium]
MAREDDYDDEYDDDFEEVEEFDDVEDVEELDEADEIEDVEEVEEAEEADVDATARKGRRQLQRGRLSRFGDSLTGGAARPGQEDIKKSPFVMVMGGAIVALALVVLIVGVMILTASEERAFTHAEQKLKEESYTEAEKLLVKFLENYSTGSYADKARIYLHTARVKQYSELKTLTADDVKNGVEQLNELIRVCRDIPGFDEEREHIRTYARNLSSQGAQVAEAKRNPAPLEQSMIAFKLLEQFSAPDGIPASVDAELRGWQDKASAAITKQNYLTKYLTEIQGHLEKGDTFAALESRQSLIDSFPVLRDDADVAKVLDSILAREKELATSQDVGQDASQEEIASSTLPAALLTLRTKSNNVSQGRLVFAIGLDSCFGLDSETGEPVWRRQVGTSAPFAPIMVNAAQPGLLVFHTGLSELVLLAQKDGSLMWRQKLPARPSGEPLIFEQQIYLTTTAGDVFRISVDSGRIISKVSFNQPVVGPPAVTRDATHMVLPGDQSVVYTMTINPLECVAVSYIEHRLGSVEAPLLTMGDILLMCDNDVAEEARLRVLHVDPSTGKVSVRYEEKVEGQVRDKCLLRGTELFVPSTPQRIMAFSVNDAPDANPPIARIGPNQLPNPSPAPIHLLAGPGGQLWMASESLRKLRVRTNAVELESDVEAEGLHLQPIQFLDQKAFLTTNKPYSSSVFFTKVDPQKMQGEWRTVVGTNIVAAGTSGNGEMLLVSDFDSVFRVPLKDIRGGGFVLDRINNYQIPAKLRDPIGGLRLKDGRLAPWCRGAEPTLWTFTPAGQLEQKWALPAEPVLPPVSLANGVVFAMADRLHCTAVKGSRVEDYRAAQGQNEQTSWKSLVAVSDTQVLALNSNNEAVRVEFRPSPRPHLLEVSTTRLPDPIELRPTPAGDQLVAITAEGGLQLLSAATLELLGKVQLEGQPSQSAYVSGGKIFVDIARRQLKVLELNAGLKQTGSLELGNRFLVGQPVAISGGGFVACLSDGEVLVLDADGNPTGKSMKLGQAASMGPLVVDDALVVITIDGSLYSVEHVIN